MNKSLFPPLPTFSFVKVKPGCKGDARMNKAVDAKLKDSSLSLYDALLAGGFNYPRNVDAATLDNDCVTLGQRKNQLNRRLRMARSKAKIEAKEKTSQSQDISAKKSSMGSSAALKVAGGYIRQQGRKREAEANRSLRVATKKDRGKKQRTNEPATQITPQLLPGHANGALTKHDSYYPSVQLSPIEGINVDRDASSLGNSSFTPDQDLSLASILMDAAFVGSQDEEYADDLAPRRCFPPGHIVHENGLASPVTKQHADMQQTMFLEEQLPQSNSQYSSGYNFALAGDQISEHRVMPSPEQNIMALQSQQAPLFNGGLQPLTPCFPPQCVSADSTVCEATYNTVPGARNINATWNQRSTVKQDATFLDFSAARFFNPTTGPIQQQEHMAQRNTGQYQQNDMFRVVSDTKDASGEPPINHQDELMLSLLAKFTVENSAAIRQREYASFNK